MPIAITDDKGTKAFGKNQIFFPFMGAKEWEIYTISCLHCSKKTTQIQYLGSLVSSLPSNPVISINLTFLELNSDYLFFFDGTILINKNKSYKTIWYSKSWL